MICLFCASASSIALNYFKKKSFLKIFPFPIQSKKFESVDVAAIDKTAADSLIVENESFESVNLPLNTHRAIRFETILVPVVHIIIDNDNIIMGPTRPR